MKTIAEVLADHQVESRGMTYGTPDTCRCETRTYPRPRLPYDHRHPEDYEADYDITRERDIAFARHQADMIEEERKPKFVAQGGVIHGAPTFAPEPGEQIIRQDKETGVMTISPVLRARQRRLNSLRIRRARAANREA